MKSRPFYELGFWLKDQGPNYDPLSDFDKIKELISSNGGEIKKSANPRRRRLAYPIKKNLVGFFSYILFYFKPESVKELKEKLDQDKNLIRYLLIKKEEEKEGVPRMRPRIRTEETAAPPDSDEFEKKLAEILGN